MRSKAADLPYDIENTEGRYFMPSLKRVFTLRLKDEYFDKLEVVTKKDHRRLTNLIELVVIKYI